MRKSNFLIALVCVIAFVQLTNCQTPKHTCTTVDTDSIKVATIDSLQKIQNIELKYWKFKVDSVSAENNHYKKVIEEVDSIIADTKEDLLISNYKLERIKYYNKIAANGNNLKFLRGWINRVLNEE